MEKNMLLQFSLKQSPKENQSNTIWFLKDLMNDDDNFSGLFSF